jgi:uncharacterized protein
MVDSTGKAAMVYAVARGFPKVVRVLLDHGVDVNARYGNELTALMWTAGYSSEAGTEDIVETLNLLLDHGARINDQDDRGRTALMIAAELGHGAAVDLLIRRGADMAVHDKAGKTALDLAESDELKAKLTSK